jgi:putative peptide zinc metalloprotease protein
VKRYRLRADLTVVEQTYRGEQSFIVKERATHKYFRFKLLEVLVMQQLDGEQSCAQVAATLAEQGFPLKPATVEVFARKLDAMGLLERTVAEKSVLLMERLRAERNRRVKTKKSRTQGSMLRMRWSAGDPDELFNRWTPRLGFFFSKPFVAISLVLFVTYFAIIIGKHQAFLTSLRALYHPSAWSLGFFVVFWVTGCSVIVIHEFGHGFACKHFGGEVHEMGAMLIYFQPAFYCNVNDAWTFPELKARLWVTAAGSWIQMCVAGLAAIVWWAVEPDTLVSQVALIAVLIGGATTVFANANPLIPLDGYYMLSDWLEVPNLRQRAFAYIGYLVKRYLLRVSVPAMAVDEREKRVFMIYGLLAICYSAMLLTLLVSRLFLWVSVTLGALGVIAFLLLVWAGLRRRIGAAAAALATSAREHRGAFRSPLLRRRAAAVGAAALLVGVLVPMPIRVGGTFRAATPVDLAMTAPADGVVGRVLVAEGQTVAPGTPLVELRSLERETETIALEARVDSLEGRERRARAQGATEDAARLEAARAEVQGSLDALRARQRVMTLRAPLAGVVVTPRIAELAGRRVEQGDTVVQLIGAGDSLELRIALEQAGATLVRPGQRASLVPLSDVGRGLRTRVASVATSGAGAGRAGVAPAAGPIEARARVAASPAWRAGVTGEAVITVRRSNLIGFLWWGLRKRVRSDLLL